MILASFELADGTTLAGEYTSLKDVPFDSPPEWLEDAGRSWDGSEDDPIYLFGKVREGFEAEARGLLS